MKVREITHSEYRNFCQNHTVDWLQSWEFAKFKEKRGWKNYFLGLFDRNEIVEACVISKKYDRFYLEMAELKNNQIISSACEFVDLKNPISFSIYPKVVKNIRDNELNIACGYDWGFSEYFRLHGFRHYPGFRHGFSEKVNAMVYVKDIKFDSIEDISLSYNQSIRRSLKLSMKYNLEVVKLNNENIDDILSNFKSSNDKNGVPSKDELYYRDFIDLMSGKIEFYGVKYKNKIISVASFIHNNDELIYFEGGSLENFLFTGASVFLQDYAIKYAFQKGYYKYNFYGICGDPQNGVLRFKAKFKGYAVEYIGEFRKEYFFRKILRKIFD